MAKENRSWGYDRIVGALANLGHQVSDQTVGNVLRRRGIAPAPERRRTTTWAEFIRAHLAVLVGTDFFTVEVLTLRGLVTYYVLLFIHLESCKVEIAGITTHPTEQWMKQMARNITMEGSVAVRDSRYLLHDRDSKYTASFLAIIESAHVKTPRLPARSPKFECVFRTLGKIGEGGVFVKAHPLWRTFLTTSDEGIRCALPRRAKSSGEVQRPVVSSSRGNSL